MMPVNTKAAVSMAEANQNFSKVMGLAEQEGQVVILQNGRPKFLLRDLDASPAADVSEDERIGFAAARILSRYREAFEELAK